MTGKPETAPLPVVLGPFHKLPAASSGLGILYRQILATWSTSCGLFQRLKSVAQSGLDPNMD